MKKTTASYEIITPLDVKAIYRRIEEAGRTCYKSEDQITEESAPKFVSMIMGRGHESVIEHITLSVRFISNRGYTHENVRHRIGSYSQESTRYCNYSKAKFGSEINCIDLEPAMRIELLGKDLTQKITEKWLKRDGWELHSKDSKWWKKGELNYQLKTNELFYPMIGNPMMTMPKFTVKTVGELKDRMINAHLELVDTAWNHAEYIYNQLISYGASAQIARNVLPIGLKTEIVATYNLRQWREIFKQRTAPAAHPNMRELMIPLLKEFAEAMPEIFGDLL